MNWKSLHKRISRYINRLNGNTIQYDLTPYFEYVEKIHTSWETIQHQRDSELKLRARELRFQAEKKPLETLLIESFALVKETIRRIMNIDPFNEQIIGGIVLHEGKIAQMQTGEGKTLTALFPVFLNSLTGNGVHVLTFNDYLAKRDALWAGPVYSFLGCSVGFVQQGMTSEERRAAYKKDITYLTAKESGFDYLRDCLAYRAEERVHRNLPYAIIDEADSILIDEARVPLVIARCTDEQVNGCHNASRAVQLLSAGVDFEFDEYSRNANLTEAGINRMESFFSCGNIYDDTNRDLLSRIYYALHALHLIHRDKDYIVKNGRVFIVDEFTGRIADGRKWPDGLQAAVEAKENCTILPKGEILNSITLQHYLNLYRRKGGMTATAEQSEEELRTFYALHTVIIPPHKPCIRIDHPDKLFRTKREKTDALVQEITAVHKTGRPVLVGTLNVSESEDLSAKLRFNGIYCEVLNAKEDVREAEIIAQAGKLGAVTISTNMAGRGTDIKLGGSDEHNRQRVAALGGLYVIGTNRHESLRIDRQLRGRAGRQGDPGTSRFFVSLEDDLSIKYRLQNLLPPQLYDTGTDQFHNKILRTEINRVQRIIEGQNLEIKITLYKYSILCEQQRLIMLHKRTAITDSQEAVSHFTAHEPKLCSAIQNAVGEERFREIARNIFLSHFDQIWSRYLAELREIQDSIHFRRYGGQEPLFEFRKVTIGIFNSLLQEIESEALKNFREIRIEGANVKTDDADRKSSGATWTYLVSDDQTGQNLEMQLGLNIGLSAWAGLLFPLSGLLLLAKRSKLLSKKLMQL